MTSNSSNRVAIMQPYIFPYIGYIHLVYLSDKFVFYDDVTFIKHGWINRNNIVLSGREHRFSIPMTNLSSNVLIKDSLTFNMSSYKKKLLKQIALSYNQSSYKNSVLDYVDDVLNLSSPSISELAISSIKKFFEYVGINKDFYKSSDRFAHTIGLGRVERLVSITKELNSNTYINLKGGSSLYSKKEFANKGVNLYFIESLPFTYRQCNLKDSHFIKNLSIIDIMMNLSADEIRSKLASCILI